MILRDENYDPLDTDDFFSEDDPDKRGLELCLKYISNFECKKCSQFELIVTDALINLFMERLERRGFPRKLIDAYSHFYNSIKAVHCLYTDLAEVR